MPRSFLIPDLLVVQLTAIRTGSFLDPGDGVLAVEAVSPSSRTHDLSTKRMRCAEVAIPHYWILEQDPVRVRVLRLRRNAYEESLHSGEVELTVPFHVEIDVDALADRSSPRHLIRWRSA